MTAPIAPDRRRLPTRRPQITEKISINGASLILSAGIDPRSGNVSELFLAGSKEGSTMDVLASDAAVVVSVALQYGVPLDALARSISRIPTNQINPERLGQPDVETAPASVIGAALDALIKIKEMSHVA
jgi:ribonucleoside-diphosphate reductase alpha chain